VVTVAAKAAVAEFFDGNWVAADGAGGFAAFSADDAPVFLNYGGANNRLL
jgi:hypothetical protein